MRKWDKSLELLSVILIAPKKKKKGEAGWLPRIELVQRKTQLGGERGTPMMSFEPLLLCLKPIHTPFSDLSH